MTQARLERKSVLVVEDEVNIAKVCKKILDAEGFDVEIAPNGEVALEMWLEKDYDLCISDIRTPQMNGIELYQQLKIQKPEAVERFIFTTGDILSKNVREFLDENGRPYLPKPFAPDTFRSIVRMAWITIRHSECVEHA